MKEREKLEERETEMGMDGVNFETLKSEEGGAEFRLTEKKGSEGKVV